MVSCLRIYFGQIQVLKMQLFFPSSLLSCSEHIWGMRENKRENGICGLCFLLCMGRPPKGQWREPSPWPGSDTCSPQCCKSQTSPHKWHPEAS